ncbi:IclR family transcriptional regulator [Pseudalkalibacillus decolorationis]|uniref:IclR family transcriptional regulator n=1 Tax=Pseudalkalibacillus decolorationis TaxID=163879 RepID=UPI00214759E1|nr:IclR family transcriptional regulator [Pseudalkalibacillus decolorationis]
MGEKKEKVSAVSSVDKAIDILVALGQSDNKTIRELGHQLEITKSTLHRILQTLENRGLVKKNNTTDKYSLGYKILELSSHLKIHNEIRDLALKHMEELRDLIGDTVQLAILEKDEIIIIETVEGTNNLRFFAQPGQKYPITYGNFGKVFLAYQPTSSVLNHIKENPLVKYASSSITDHDQFIKQVNEVRNDKISVSIDDPIEGAVSIAVPIVNTNGHIEASLAIAGVKTQQKMDNIDQLKVIIKEYADKISNEFK